jgi:hypothetical protein
VRQALPSSIFAAMAAYAATVVAVLDLRVPIQRTNLVMTPDMAVLVYKGYAVVHAS